MKLFQKKANLPFYILAFFIYLIPTVMVLGFFALPTVSIVENVKNQKNGVAFIEMQDAADEYGWNVVGIHRSGHAAVLRVEADAVRNRLTAQHHRLRQTVLSVSARAIL